MNLEVWNIHPDINITDIDLEGKSMLGDGVIANTEIEIPLTEAETLVQQFIEAIKVARDKNNE